MFREPIPYRLREPRVVIHVAITETQEQVFRVHVPAYHGTSKKYTSAAAIITAIASTLSASGSVMASRILSIRSPTPETRRI